MRMIDYFYLFDYSRSDTDTHLRIIEMDLAANQTAADFTEEAIKNEELQSDFIALVSTFPFVNFRQCVELLIQHNFNLGDLFENLERAFAKALEDDDSEVKKYIKASSR